MIIFVQLFALLMSCSALQKSTEAGRDNTPLEVLLSPPSLARCLERIPVAALGRGRQWNTGQEPFWVRLTFSSTKTMPAVSVRCCSGRRPIQTSFPFGKLFVTAYYYDQQGALRYAGYDIIENPTPADNAYALDVMVDSSHNAEE